MQRVAEAYIEKFSEFGGDLGVQISPLPPSSSHPCMNFFAAFGNTVVVFPSCIYVKYLTGLSRPYQSVV